MGAVRRDLEVMRDGLHANAVRLFGTNLDDLVGAAGVAVECGLRPWVSPRLIGESMDATVAHLVAAAEGLEALRSAGADVTFVLGCEASVFVEGIVPGEDREAREARMFTLPTLVLNAVGVDPGFQASLNAYLGRALGEVRARFGGPVTYAAGIWERVDWEPFDIVGLDYYRTWHNRLGYRRRLRDLRALGKPVAVLEFGCATYEGAGAKGGAGQVAAVDYGADPPAIREGVVRSEDAQAAYIEALLAIYREEQVSGVFVFLFNAPASPHAADPRHDLDTASYALVTALPPGSGRAYEDGYWQPKRAFHVVADAYLRD
ncbi:MAG: abortive infection protein, partial [Vicinamibacterales bacterium]